MTATKAAVAAIIVALSAFIATVQGRTDIETMGTVDWIIVVISAVVAGLVVYIAPNRPTGA